MAERNSATVFGQIVQRKGVNMHVTKIVGLAVLGSLFGGISTPAVGETIPAVEIGGKIRWVYSYDEGKQRARETGKPLFVVFRCER